MERVLHAVDGMSIGGGIQSFIMNVYRNIDREKVQFDFLLHRHNKYSYEEEIEKLGGRIYYVAGRKSGIQKNKKELDEFFKKHKEYQVVHFHCSSLSYIEPLVAAYNNGVKVRVIHSHSSKIIGKNKVIHLMNHRLNKYRIKKIATDYLACGEVASEWMYSGTGVINKVKIITNGIDINRFSFSEEIRQRKRMELGLGEELLFCHVGRFETVKNHQFLLKVFQKIIAMQPNARLILIGGGTLFNDIYTLSHELNLSDKVMFLGVRNDVNELYQAADVVVLPSLYEGFPVTAIEAQATGVMFVMSDTITQEALLKENAFSMSLSSSYQEWAEFLLSNIRRCNDNSVIINKGMDITTTVQKLMDIYFD